MATQGYAAGSDRGGAQELIQQVHSIGALWDTASTDRLAAQLEWQLQGGSLYCFAQHAYGVYRPGREPGPGDTAHLPLDYSANPGANRRF
jgi:hypothetical protein